MPLLPLDMPGAQSKLSQVHHTMPPSLHVLWIAALGLNLGRNAQAADVSPLRQDAYIWQRAWTESVTASVRTLATNFSELIVLRAEVTWPQGKPRLAEAHPDFAALAAGGRPVALALRIGSFGGPFESNDERIRWLSGLARRLIETSRTNGIIPAELQLDFDCAEAKLDGYRVWVQAIKRAVQPVPVTITALPSWLPHVEFARLIEAADGYVLQVHSFARPQNEDAPIQICDPAAARAAVTRASQLGRPFRVALPTYGYLVAFDPAGRFVGLSAEGPLRTWPNGVKIREVRTDPDAMAGLVREWTRNRPHSLTGVIWYRLPVTDDAMNWRWPTLDAVMAGENPKANLQVLPLRRNATLFELELTNAGTADTFVDRPVLLRWSSARLVAADGVNGFAFEDTSARSARLTPRAGRIQLPAGQRLLIGWVRLDSETNLSATISESAELQSKPATLNEQDAASGEPQ